MTFFLVIEKLLVALIKIQKCKFSSIILDSTKKIILVGTTKEVRLIMFKCKFIETWRDRLI